MSELETVRGLAHGALEALEQSRERIDDLNVYPVPDGDTGTNLTLTARGVVEALDASTAADRHALAREATRAALMSARGNSGVILSQIVRGAADSLADSDDLARAFRARERRGVRGGAQAGRGDDADRHPLARRGGGGGTGARARRAARAAGRARG